MVDFKRIGTGPPLVYVAGIEGTGRNFYRQAADLSRDHTVLSFQWRPAGRYGLETLVDDLVAVVRESGFERVTVLGESFGGLVVLAAALAHPNLFERMILVNSFAAFPHPAKIRVGVVLYSVAPKLVKAYRARTGPRTLFSEDIAEEDRLAFRENTRDVPLEGYVSRMRIIKRTDLRSRLPDIKVPALIIAGTEDRLMNAVAAGREMAAGLPRSRLKLLEGTGHMALLSTRVHVREWLKEFSGI